MKALVYPLNPNRFNNHCHLPYQLTTEHVQQSMQDWLDFLQLINEQLHNHQLPYLEQWLMPATLSGMVSEFLSTRLPIYCSK
ncbi:hypothetical protein [Chloroflexus sp.]|uniref:hypothetical protein n=1 Tax=Chloroflexus sp. TaxID=1904827 RepID=UPI00298F1CAD|nr:hypothetical protein [Chloroflexus sp.]MDW8405205.1 hypothetical protein [Chloroflexus sp.]